MNDLAVKALRALDSELKNHNITARVELKTQLPACHGQQWSIAGGHRQLDPERD